MNPFDVLEAKIDALAAKVDTLESRLRPAPARTRKYATLTECAAHLRCSVRHVKDLRRQPGFPVVGEGRALRVDLERLDEWMLRRAQKPSIEELARAAARRTR